MEAKIKFCSWRSPSSTAIGQVWNSLSVVSVPISDVELSKRGVSAETVIRSEISPSSSAKSTVTVCATRTSTLSLTAVLKPFKEADIV
jgi:hypothetical protein